MIAIGGEKRHFFDNDRRYLQAMSGGYGQEKQRRIIKRMTFPTQRMIVKYALRF